MRLGLMLTTVAVKTKKEGVIEKETEIDAEGEIDAAEGITNKAIRCYRTNLILHLKKRVARYLLD